MKLSLLLITLFSLTVCFSQFTQADSLRGGYGEGRNWWDLTHYNLAVDFNIDQKTISGSNIVTFNKLFYPKKPNDFWVQIDLQEPMIVDSVVWLNSSISHAILGESLLKTGNAYRIPIALSQINSENEVFSFQVYFHGKPRAAKNAPWDGGVIWKSDKNGKPWVTVACQGLGASVWFPCKDSQLDEPDSVDLKFTFPSDLVCVSNGRNMKNVDLKNGKTASFWKVSEPINNYCMIPYIGDYVNIHEHFKGENGILDLDYWVLKGNESIAKKQFQDVPRTIEALEYWFGPYPFYADGYKLVEAPHLGMEHQSAIAYGNGFKNGYLGTDLSKTGEGLKWDYIIVHESGHEWFGNNITSKDIADMWIHEAFTDFSETLFMDYWFGTKAANSYCRGLRKNIRNDEPIIGQYGVQQEGSGDMYFKGANLLQTIRQIVGNDTIFRKMLRKMNTEFYHQTVSTEQIESFMIKELNLNLSPVFDQYLRTNKPPTLELNYSKNTMTYRFINCNADFKMQLVTSTGQLNCTTELQTIDFNKGNVPRISSNQYLILDVHNSRKFSKANKGFVVEFE